MKFAIFILSSRDKNRFTKIIKTIYKLKNWFFFVSNAVYFTIYCVKKVKTVSILITSVHCQRTPQQSALSKLKHDWLPPFSARELNFERCGWKNWVFNSMRRAASCISRSFIARVSGSRMGLKVTEKILKNCEIFYWN